MIESYLEDGSQKIGEGVFGKIHYRPLPWLGKNGGADLQYSGQWKSQKRRPLFHRTEIKTVILHRHVCTANVWQRYIRQYKTLPKYRPTLRHLCIITVFYFFSLCDEAAA